MSTSAYKNADTYLVLHDTEDEDACCSLEMTDGNGGRYSGKLKLHHNPEDGWTTLALIEGLVNHLRWTQQGGGETTRQTELAIKHLERAWSALAAEHPIESEDPP